MIEEKGMKGHYQDLEGLPVWVERKAIRHMYIRIKGKQVQVSAPLRYSQQEIRAVLLKRRPWIDVHLEKQKGRATLPVCPNCVAVGTQVSLWGNLLCLTLHDERPKPGELALLKTREHSATNQEILETWLKQEMEERASLLIQEWSAKLKIELKTWQIRRMKGRWGSCHLRDRKIVLNLNLVHQPIPRLEYVVVHELLHLYERGHNPRFYGLLNQYYPGWQTSHDVLKYHSFKEEDHDKIQ